MPTVYVSKTTVAKSFEDFNVQFGTCLALQLAFSSRWMLYLLTCTMGFAPIKRTYTGMFTENEQKQHNGRKAVAEKKIEK